jgi:undecaprenyl pyrophosphate synthase
MAIPKLRAVGRNEQSQKPAVPKTVTVAATDGSRRELLVAMRSRVATAVEDPNTPARDLAALTRRLMEIAKDIEVLDVKDAEEADCGAANDETFDAEAI